MTDLINNITADLQKQIDSYETEVEVTDVGTVLEAGDGIARVDGLSSVRAQELVQFQEIVEALAIRMGKLD